MQHIFELARGASEEQLDQIEAIIRDSLERATSAADFERLTNRQLEPFNVRFSSSHPTLASTRAPAMYDGTAVVLNTNFIYQPQLGADSVARGTRIMISHELVHHAQHQAAEKTGDVGKLADQGGRLQTTTGQVNWERYTEDPHENMAYARSEVDVMRAMGFSQKEILRRLQQGKRSSGMNYAPADKKRFLKNAYRFATESRAQRIVTNLLES
jgi:hypothetical protein